MSDHRGGRFKKEKRFRRHRTPKFFGVVEIVQTDTENFRGFNRCKKPDSLKRYFLVCNFMFFINTVSDDIDGIIG
jgi:hypothetical protein